MNLLQELTLASAIVRSAKKPEPKAKQCCLCHAADRHTSKTGRVGKYCKPCMLAQNKQNYHNRKKAK